MTEMGVFVLRNFLIASVSFILCTNVLIEPTSLYILLFKEDSLIKTALANSELLQLRE